VAVLPGARAPAESRPAPPWWRTGGISLPSVAVPLLLAPAAILIAESLALKPLYVDRYVLYGQAGAALLAGGGAYRIGRWLADAVTRRPARTAEPARLAGLSRTGALTWVPGVVVCLCFGALQFGAQQHARTPGSRRYDFGGPSRYVGASARKGDGILFFGSFYRKAELGYPQDFRHTADFAMAEPPLRAGNFRGTDKRFAVTGPLMLGYRRIWVFGTRPAANKPDPQTRAESIELMRDFTLIRQQRFHGILVTLWLRR
jgi:mannosyltransferase